MSGVKPNKKVETITSADKLHHRRLQKILKNNRNSLLIPMGELMGAHLNYVRGKERQKAKKD